MALLEALEDLQVDEQAARVGRVTDRRASLSDQLDSLLDSQVNSMWSGLTEDDFSNEAVVGRVAARSAEASFRAQKQRRLQSRSVNSTLLRELDALTKELPPIVEQYERNADPLDVYGRPAKTYEKARGSGKSHIEALIDVHDRVKSITSMDLKIAEWAEDRKVLEAQPRVVGYRRVIHPERSETGVCGLCVVASTQFYNVGELMPIHEHCKCQTMPVVKGSDPGLKLNSEDLREIYDLAGGTSAEFLKGVRLTTVPHGEVGPYLQSVTDSYGRPWNPVIRAHGATSRASTGVRGSRNYEPPTIEQQIEVARRNLAACESSLVRQNEANESGVPVRWERLGHEGIFAPGDRTATQELQQSVAFFQKRLNDLLKHIAK